ncbi:hypothetical protein DO021_09820 [Desulfobacter hydrogenophilus]|uniref:Hsp70 family protein n=1 Tax=Desulfobacter hydrogenophilus TaxID=2291 RepID=A0A328FCC9_9BACT|nr:Hsp70 family protein [Desulfobacter hydrogenophilus]NDY72223.1 Hsp70 family protein [Desulfobacter hydrogenophilus]QBH15095.1 Hsp70 family protein [Desulfobacter hydrogenophilus]RAM02228.1 hypothetical protein DO021_09820 [Desulfobacter hydrogenophilus]
MSKSIGIDLGTTNSASGIKKVHVEIIPNSEGDTITPSCVCIKNNKIRGLLNRPKFVVGKHALEWIKQEPAGTITAVKRLMGRSITNPEVQKLINDPRHAFIIAGQSKGTDNSLVIRISDREYSPEEISSKILEKIRKDAEKNLGDKVEYAVITVPAYFNDKQKHATRTAAALAGIKVQRLLSEPTAAAISFGVDQVNEDDAKTILVFDFGGGTFDLSVLTISGGQFIEQGKGGNMWLGGEDIDRKLEEYVLQETAREYEIDDIAGMIAEQDSGVRNRFLGELKAAVEQAKIKLSDGPEAYIELLGLLKDADGDLLDVDVTVTREAFEELIRPAVQNTQTLVQKLLDDIYFSPDLIDNVLLVGGSSKIPCIVKAMEDMFGKEKVMLHDRPMLAVAEGAAILSHRLADNYECMGCGGIVGQSDVLCSHCGFDLEKHTIDQGVFNIVHAAAHDYYVTLDNGERYLFVEKNTPLPCEQEEVFRLVDAYQQLIHMKFFNIVNDAEESIGDFWLSIDADAIQEYRSNSDQKESDTPFSISVNLKIDENNIVAVSGVLTQLPDVSLSKTLSRGKADEKLFMELETMIDQANADESDNYAVEELTLRSADIVKDLHKVLHETTGEVIETVYTLAKMKIDKAKQLFEENILCYSMIFYAESVLEDFPWVLTDKERSALVKKIEVLQAMNRTGTYEQNVDAFDDLDQFLETFPLINMLMDISKAGELCDIHDPKKAASFYNAIATLMKAVGNTNIEMVSKTIDKIMPEALDVISKYDSTVGIVQKGVVR